MTQFARIPGTLVVGIGYKAQHGKSTIARRWAVTDHAERFELSTYVATVARTFYGMTRRDVAKLVAVGQGMRALLDEEIWLRCCYYDILDKRPAIAVVPNIRFPNEAALIKAMGGYLVNVTRVTPDGAPFVSPDRDPHAITETAMDGFEGWDYAITNRGTDDLARDADRTLRAIKQRHADAS